MSRKTIKEIEEAKKHALSPLFLGRACLECSYFSEDRLDCWKWLKPKRRDGEACHYFSPIQRIIMPIIEVIAVGASNKLDVFCKELRALTEKSGYKMVIQPRKNLRTIIIHNPGNGFGRKLLTLLAKHSKKLEVEIKQKTEVKIEKHKL